VAVTFKTQTGIKKEIVKINLKSKELSLFIIIFDHIININYIKEFGI
jgi:hypothetical protein